MSARGISGLDYTGRNPEAVTRPLEDWKELQATVLKAGGKRRVEGGDTFLRGPDGRLVHEAWANIPKAAA